jgi:cyclic-di-GMP-binding protein
MPLNLRTPTVLESPAIIALTSPSKIKSFLAQLPAASPFESGNSLLEELEILNRQKVASSARLKALELYRPVIFNLQKMLDSQYCNKRIPLATKSKTYADLIKSLYTELAYGYKHALLSNNGPHFALNQKNHTALLVQRCMESLRNVSFICYQCYIATPLGTWSELNQLFIYAHEQGIADTPVSLNQKQKSSVALTFKQALLMQLATPQNLSHTDIKLTAQYIFKNAHCTELKPILEVDMQHATSAAFVLPLSSDLPPTTLRDNTNFSHDHGNFVLFTHKIVEKIRLDVQSTLAKEPHKNIIFDHSINDAKHLGLLRYLYQHWGSFPRRVYSRVKKLDAVEVNIGISSIHYFLNQTLTSSPKAQPITMDTLFGESPDLEKTLLEKTHQDEAHEPHPQITRWISYNVSATGVALRKPNNVDQDVRVGDLIAIRELGKTTWSLAVIKWVMLKDQQKLDIGLQLIAPNAHAKNARQIKQNHLEKILLLSGIPTLRQSASIVAPTGIYRPTNQLELIEDNQTTRIVITKRIERTSSYERFSFTYLQ